MDPTTYVEQHRERFLAQLQDLLRIPSVSALSQHRSDVCRAADWVAEEQRVFAPFHATLSPDGP